MNTWVSNHLSLRVTMTRINSQKFHIISSVHQQFISEQMIYLFWQGETEGIQRGLKVTSSQHNSICWFQVQVEVFWQPNLVLFLFWHVLSALCGHVTKFSLVACERKQHGSFPELAHKSSSPCSPLLPLDWTVMVLSSVIECQEARVSISLSAWMAASKDDPQTRTMVRK